MDKAIAAYRAVVAAFPDRVEPLLALANQLDAKGQVDEAAKQVDAAAKLDPDNAEAEDLKYQLLAEKGGMGKRSGWACRGARPTLTHRQALACAMARRFCGWAFRSRPGCCSSGRRCCCQAIPIRA
ncbi:tetratricopeptide repeat protein [Novosphingobium colocasiae]